MKFLFVSFIMLCLFCTVTWGETLAVSNENITARQVINAAGYDTIIFMNSRFNESVTIINNKSLKTLRIHNCDFADLLSIKNNPSLEVFSISSSDFEKHLLVTGNTIAGMAVFSDNIINGYLQLSQNQMREQCSIRLTRIERGLSCFQNTFTSKFKIDSTDLKARAVLYGNRYNTVEFNDVVFGELTMRDSGLEHSMDFADCTVTAQLEIRRINEIDTTENKHSIGFFNTCVYNNVYFEDVDPSILLIDLWQLHFYQDIFIDFDRLTSSIGLVTERIVHNPESIERIVIINPYKELNKESKQKFDQLFYNVKAGYDKRGDKEAKIRFYKWEYHYKNNLHGPLKKMLNTMLFYFSFELFLNLYIPIIISLVICIIFMFVFLRKNESDKKNDYRYLKINTVSKRCFTAFLVSVSVFCSLPLATKKIREEEARTITWIEGLLGMIMLIIIGAIVGRIASI